ncbi:large conductance mechanosensitive channel protein MscL [Cytophagaceae bacterium DM2B3-1]|uniref:Large-conductance mechanosensitive channel n=1 Tax=Xanthocytophaga flava TaxID=3048013 RepID=A0AAE3QV94_9BACT|nr:large conductance mechanosensitive channel protein MscL [Xanthocytophaga flavus]MDJ1472750.1 large conductance mechanosensitive channel protein MscL [Xanthocytophaga flavus]MDJ1484175.1 large conductance mechanosensitive channel protein MscL [Xanthocytophaga flavus]MDJ1496123.1 large conductance mechanosensitive channel protein MscL [Xanthocytophaga flavus]
MGFISEFREFALKGNVIDLAVGVIIGGAFGKIIDSIVKDMIMPVVSIPGSVDFSNLYLPLSRKVQDGLEQAGGKLSLDKARELGPVLAYGSFITVAFNFIILAMIIFLMVKAINSLKRKHQDVPPPPAPPTKEEVLLTEIRDLLKAGR